MRVWLPSGGAPARPERGGGRRGGDAGAAGAGASATVGAAAGAAASTASATGAAGVSATGAAGAGALAAAAAAAASARARALAAARSAAWRSWASVDGALARGAFLGGEPVVGRARGTRRGRRRGARLEQALLSRGGRSQVAAARDGGARALGLDDHRLGTAVAEALLHRAGADRSGPTGLEGQGLAPAGGGGTAVVVLVAHALALLVGRRIRPKDRLSNRGSS